MQTLAELEKRLAKKYKKDKVFGTTPHKGAISSGIIELDIASGIGGFPKGKYVEMFGLESSGKSLICLKAIATAQRLYPDKLCAYLDLEHGTPESWMAQNGVDVSRCFGLDTEQIDSGELQLALMLDLVKSGTFSVIVLDSIPGLVPAKVLNGEIDRADQPGEDARMLTKGLRKLIPALAHSDTAAILVNQTRDKVGVMWGSNETTPGGKALRFYAVQRWRITRKSGRGNTFADGKEVLGHTIAFKVVKNKLGPPQREGEFDVYYGTGVNNARLLLKWGVAVGVIGAKGHTYTLDDATYNGRQAFYDAVNADFSFERALHGRILEQAIAEHRALVVEKAEEDERTLTDFGIVEDDDPAETTGDEE